jgi:hypothetical protein
MAIAIAGYMVSTDLEYNNIIVQKKHVDIACTLLESIYNNPTFKLKEFVDEERKRVDCTLKDVELIKEMLIRYPNLLGYLENNNNVAKNTLMTVSGLDLDVFGSAIQKLSQNSFVTLTRDRIYPTPKLLTAIKKARTIV